MQNTKKTRISFAAGSLFAALMFLIACRLCHYRQRQRQYPGP